MFNCAKEMNKFHQEKVTLSGKEQGEMKNRRDTNRNRLKKGLADNGKPVAKGCYSQGSYRMRTMVQDDQGDYDIDDGVYFTRRSLQDSNGDDESYENVRRMVHDAVVRDQRFKKSPEQKSKCVRVYYNEGYHIDLPIYRITGEEDNEVYELATKYGWEKSDALQLTTWFNEHFGKNLNKGEDDPQQMRRIVRFTKKFARSRITDEDNWKEKMPSGICITKLVVNHYVQKESRDNESLYETWSKIVQALNCSLRVEHPTEADKTLSDGDNDPKVEFLRNKLNWAVKELEITQQFNCTQKEILERWNTVFNTDFFTNQIFESSDKQSDPLNFGLVTKIETSLSVPHQEPPSWRITNQYRVSISGKFRERKEDNTFKPFTCTNTLPKHCDLRFHAETDTPKPFDVFWQVVNTGEEATKANGLRGEIFPAKSAGAGGLNTSHDESTLYTGTHWIESFIVKQGVCVARSDKFYVKIS